MLIDHIVFPDKKIDYLEEIKKTSLPLILIGGGSLARDVLFYLKDHGISVQGICAPDVLADIKEQYGISFVDIEKVDYPCAAVMGMSNYLLGKKIAEKNDHVKKVYYLEVMPYQEMSGYTKDAVMEMMEKYEHVYSELEDDLSRRCMAAFLNARVSGDVSAVFPCFEREQNYFDNTLYHIEKKENYLDAGAYTGDTIKKYSEESHGACGHIWAFEADKELIPKVEAAIAECGAEDRAELYMMGLWDHEGILQLNRTAYNDEEGYLTETKSQNSYPLHVDTVDHVLKDRKEQVDILKINFLGADRVLRGAAEVIRKDKPKIAAVVAFHNRMIADVPLTVKEIDPFYKIYLRFNSAMPAKLCMYALRDRN